MACRMQGSRECHEVSSTMEAAMSHEGSSMSDTPFPECHDSNVHGGTLHDDGMLHDKDNHVSTMAVSSTMEVRSTMAVSFATLSMAVSSTMGAAMSHEGA